MRCCEIQKALKTLGVPKPTQRTQKCQLVQLLQNRMVELNFLVGNETDVITCEPFVPCIHSTFFLVDFDTRKIFQFKAQLILQNCLVSGFFQNPFTRKTLAQHEFKRLVKQAVQAQEREGLPLIRVKWSENQIVVITRRTSPNQLRRRLAMVREAQRDHQENVDLLVDELKQGMDHMVGCLDDQEYAATEEQAADHCHNHMIAQTLGSVLLYQLDEYIVFEIMQLAGLDLNEARKLTHEFHDRLVNYGRPRGEDAEVDEALLAKRRAHAQCLYAETVRLALLEGVKEVLDSLHV